MTQEHDTTNDDVEKLNELADELMAAGPAHEVVARLLLLIEEQQGEIEDLNSLYMEERKRGDRLELRVEALSRKVDHLEDRIDSEEDR